MTGRNRAFLLAGLLVALLLAGGVSYYASSMPDGLEKVAADKGVDEGSRGHDLAGSPVADYAVEGVDDDRLSTALAGVAGVAVTLALGGGLFLAVRRRAPADEDAGLQRDGAASGTR
ncbi:MAG: PDGLE domain-containing protein [Actinomycetes bacterium]